MSSSSISSWIASPRIDGPPDRPHHSATPKQGQIGQNQYRSSCDLLSWLALLRIVRRPPNQTDRSDRSTPHKGTHSDPLGRTGPRRHATAGRPGLVRWLQSCWRTAERWPERSILDLRVLPRYCGPQWWDVAAVRGRCSPVVTVRRTPGLACRGRKCPGQRTLTINPSTMPRLDRSWSDRTAMSHMRSLYPDRTSSSCGPKLAGVGEVGVPPLFGVTAIRRPTQTPGGRLDAETTVEQFAHVAGARS